MPQKEVIQMLIDTISLELFRNTDSWKGHGDIFLHDRFWMLRKFNIRGREFLFSTQPYLLQEKRVVWVKKGWASYLFNLMEYRFVEGDLVVFYGDTLVEKKGNSDDFEFDAFRYDGIVDDVPTPQVKASADSGEEAEEGVSFIRLHIREEMRTIVNQYFSLLWDIVHQTPIPHESAAQIVCSLLYYARQQYGQAEVARPVTRSQDILQRFISLVSKYADRERKIPFYADKLCVAPHYLSTLIKQTSGRTVMDWINQTAVKAVKVWLAYSDETAIQISERMHFSCPASLTKFFKRATGMTPGQYRAEVKGGGMQN